MKRVFSGEGKIPPPDGLISQLAEGCGGLGGQLGVVVHQPDVGGQAVAAGKLRNP